MNRRVKIISNTTGMAIIASPAEAASFGNPIMQLIASDDINNIEEGRYIIARSIKISQYYPEDKNYWEEIYEKIKWKVTRK